MGRFSMTEKKNLFLASQLLPLPSSPNILNCRESSPDQPVKEVKKFWGPVQVLLHCESAKLKMDGASETEFLMGTVPQLEPAILQLFSVCKDVLPHIHRARTRRRALADISTPQPPWLAFDATCSSASTWYQAQDEIFANRFSLKCLCTCSASDRCPSQRGTWASNEWRRRRALSRTSKAPLP